MANKELADIASQIRRDVIRMVNNAGSGHPGGALGCTDLFTLLYFKHMKHSAAFNMDAYEEDIFHLSNGHISAVWYATLARAGYFSINELGTHRKIDSRLQGHPTPWEHLEGIRCASGSLGQGLSVGLGMALSKKFNKDLHKVFILMGDGEQQEGQIWEAAIFAAHHKVDNLIAFIDYNGQQIDGPTTEVMNLGDLRSKYDSFGWKTYAVDGNDMEALDLCIQEAKENCGKGKPQAVMMKTEMGYPIDYMMGTHEWHGIAPNDEQKEIALSQLTETLGDFKL